jgi:23S rRNA (uracil1939-C5)-methyltransferase
VAFHEEVAGHRFRVSARSFFQSRPDGADALVELVRRAIEHRFDAPPAQLVDLYAGVGLFAATLGAARVTAVERAKSSVGDARHNLPAGTGVLALDVGRWRATPAEVVVADPAREGLGAKVVEQVAATGASMVALVSCDAGALGRDAASLVAAGFELSSVTLVDMFPDTHHVEVVSIFDRA